MKKTKKKAPVKKSKAKAKKQPSVPKGIKRRGRPPGSTNKKGTKKPVDEPQEITWKTFKLLGFCPRNACGLMIHSSDLVSKQVFLCPVCGKRDRISKLKAERKSINEKPNNKKDYLNTAVVHGEVH